MVELQSIEQLLYFMKNHIQLSRYDDKFIENISTLKQVTTNQVVLLHKLVFKYRRQFIKHDMFVEKLIELPWSVTVVESSPQYTDGHVSIINDVIYFRCPFNRNFIDEFRKAQLNTFTWNKVKRYYEAPYNVYTLKLLINTAKLYFKNINYCDATKKLMEPLSFYDDVIYWQPTLVKRNNRYYILATNSVLESVLDNLNLDLSDNTLLTLCKHGVKIDNNLYENDDRLKFIGEFKHNIDKNNVPKLIEWLKQINCDHVILSSINSVNVLKQYTIKELEKAKIHFTDTSTTVVDTTNNTNPVWIKFKQFSDEIIDTLGIIKVITITNATPIEVK